jgi:virginiamycin A acetyltransferase
MREFTNFLRSYFLRRIRDSIDSNTAISRSSIVGLYKLGLGSAIEDSNLSGNILIADHTGIFNCNIAGNVSIGRYCTINGPETTIFSGIYNISIGNFCSIAPGCSIYEMNHVADRCSSYNIFRNLINAENRQDYIWRGSLDLDVSSKGPIVIGSDVWIGSQVCILSGVTIGDGAIVGANSTVTRDVPPFSIVAGNPARVVKYRFATEIIELLLSTNWWLWDDEKIRRNSKLFEGTLTLSKLLSIKN